MENYQFKTHLRKVLTRLTSEGYLIDTSNKLFLQAFTHRSFDPNENYETLETFGDTSANNAIVWYFGQRFPYLMKSPKGNEIISRLRIHYVSRAVFSDIAYNLGFLPFIRVSETVMKTYRKKVLTDVFEAFVCAVQMIYDQTHGIGFGNGLVYQIIKSYMDSIPIYLDYGHLVDMKTQLKELIDRKKDMGAITYVYSTEDTEEFLYNNVSIFISKETIQEKRQRAKKISDLAKKILEKSRIPFKTVKVEPLDENKTLLATGSAPKKLDAEQRACRNAINILAKRGLVQQLDPEYAKVVQMCKNNIYPKVPRIRMCN